MKKLLLTVITAAASLASQAFTFGPQPLGHDAIGEGGLLLPATAFPESRTAAPATRQSRAGSGTTMNYTPAGSPYSYTGLVDQRVGMKLAQTFQMTADMVSKFAGNTVEGIFFYTGMNQTLSTQSAVNTIKKATLFLSYDIEPFEPFYTQSVDLPADGLTLQTFTLDTPHTIEADKPFFVGFYTALSSTEDLTIIFDGVNHGYDVSGGWLGVQMPRTSADENPEWTFVDLSSQIGFLCVGAVITGDNLPVNEMTCPASQTQPSVYQGEPFDMAFAVQNNGANDVNSFDAEVKVGGGEPKPVRFNLEQPMGYGKTAIASVSSLVCDVPSPEVPVSVTITAINGEPNNSPTPSDTAYIQVIPSGMGYNRNVVVEEFTGTWCPYCPQGIVTMETLREAYPDGEVIPVAVHYSDEMSSSTYEKIAREYNDNYPSAVMNRQMYIDNIYPAESCIEEIEAYMSYPAPATVSATAVFNSKLNGVIFNTRTAFSFDNDNAADDYCLAFAVTEDNVGPYVQQNGFAGSGQMPGWDDKPQNVSVRFNDVARQLDDGTTLQESVPRKVEAGKEYEFTYEMKFVAATKIDDKTNLNAMVYLIDRHTGVIENACMIRNADLMASIEDVVADPDAPVEYFNLQGVRVASPSRGFYIRRQGSDSRIVALD